jgi:uncharacterized protein
VSTDDYPQVGQGWAYPPRWDLPRDRESAAHGAILDLNYGIDHVQEAMTILLRTGLGARVMRPGFGAGVDRFVFEPRTPDVCYRLADDVRRALMLGEPRVIIDTVTAEPVGQADDRIDVTIEYRIDRHRRAQSLVVPFYVGSAS